MNEIANRQQAEISHSTPDAPDASAAVDLQQWALELDSAYKFGQALATSNFVPLNLRMKSKGVSKSPDELANDVTAIILAGKSVGYDPMQSVQQLFIVHGMPSMYARSMVALVLSHGHELRRGEASQESVTWHARRKGETDWQEFTWTMQRAQLAGYTNNPKYKTNPTEMLSAKASTEACRVVFPDVLQGIAYSAEEVELEDLGERPAPPTSSATASITKPEGDSSPETISKEDWGQVQAAAAERGMDGPGLARFVSDTLGRDIAGPGSILKTELPAIIDGLSNAEGRD